ncbi:MAG: signal recognition particle protein ['Candidatus Kapabacteria' thiocyanatum]|uniref:Signal recognition particle protein n=1 Tax=Candidatus Kapaibacterium thiocyanatum TaxID=1895771 RepID=A0A1M3KWX3_9BACT|nr:signal recognition particle protein ['Candidatus Kapabacteria' thiocyanatum]OJX56912.1 MAG: signal recognition particle protein ['Candidatus Kapabacteria' thiocyanatum]
MFESLSEKLEEALKRIRGQSKITEENIGEALAEVRRALLDADVNFNVTKKFIDDVKEKSLGLEVKGNVLPGQLMIKLIHDELVALMGSTKSDIAVAAQAPTIIMVAGLQGSGKTTFCSKLAFMLKKKGRQPLLVACDIYRPAAIDQLKTLGQSISLPVFSKDDAKPLEIAQEAVQYAKKFGRDVVIVDTAGRLTIDEEMMQEVADLKSNLKPHEVLFVCDAMTGQDAVNTAQAFHERLELTGVVLTKLDGDTRGGAALSIRAVTGKPIKFVGVGEKVDALEPFYPERIASRILGMGDIITLVEKAQQQIDEKEAAKLEEKLKKNQFTFEDFLEQMRLIKKMGSLRDLLGMIPGMDKAMRNVQIDEKAFSRVEAMVLSMTIEERQNPRLLNGSRRKRIADGSGSSVQDVNRLIKQFEDMQKMMKNMTRGKMANMFGPQSPVRR